MIIYDKVYDFTEFMAKVNNYADNPKIPTIYVVREMLDNIL